jgi:predicted secreted protein
MSTTLAIAVYVVLWWTVLFVVLPLGVRTQDDDGVVVPGTPGSAPTTPRLMRIVAITTALSTALFVGLWLAGVYNLIDVGALIGRNALH